MALLERPLASIFSPPMIWKRPADHGSTVKNKEIKTPPGKTTWMLQFRSDKRFVLTVISLALLTDAFSYCLFYPALPSILSDRLHIREHNWQFWTSMIFTAFGLGDIITAPIIGWISDHFAVRRLPFILGCACQIVAMLLFGLGTKIWILILSRVLSGISGAIVYTIGLAIMMDTVEHEAVGRWMGFALSVANVGFALAPTTGGVLYTKAHIWGVAGLALALLSVDLVLRSLIVEKNDTYRRLPLAIVVQPESESSLWLSTALQISDETGRAAERTISSEALATDPKQSSKSLLGAHHLWSPRILSDCYGIFVLFSLVIGFSSVLPVFAKTRFGFSSSGVGLLYLTFRLPTVLGFWQGWLVDRYGAGTVALAGSLLTPISLILMRLISSDSKAQIAELSVLLVLFGFFGNFVLTALCTDLAQAVDRMDTLTPGIFGAKGAYATATSLLELSAALADLVAPLISVAADANIGWGNMTLMFGLWCASVSVPVVLFVGLGRPRASDEKDIAVSEFQRLSSPATEGSLV